MVDEEQLSAMISEKEGPCVSIQVRLHIEFTQRKQNESIIEHAVARARQAVEVLRCNADTKSRILERLDMAVEDYDGRPGRSLGIYVSREHAAQIRFPFEVNETVVVGDTFETRDLLYYRQYAATYLVLSLSRKEVRLFRGRAGDLVEVRDDVFPLRYQEEYAYERSSIGSSIGYGMKGFEKDKSVLAGMRTEAFVQNVVDVLPAYLDRKGVEFILAGEDRITSGLLKTFPWREQVLGTIDGEVNARSDKQLFAKAWKLCQQARSQRIEILIGKLRDLGLNYQAVGIRDVWAKAVTGQGRQLLVERDFQCRAYRPSGTDQIRLHPPKGPHLRIEDAVDDVIEKVINRGGQVVFTEPNGLREFEQIGLILRYK